jgi:hypothetical protein
MMDFHNAHVFSVKNVDNREFCSWLDYQLQDTT